MQARAELYDQLAPHVHCFLLSLRLNLSQSELEDATQETFLRLFVDLQRLDPSRSARSYVLGIARHIALDICRKKRPPILREPGAAPAVVDDIARGEESLLVQQALAALSPEHRTLLSLRHVSHLTQRELAQTLGCSRPTVRARLQRAARAFALELGRRGVTTGEEETQ